MAIVSVLESISSAMGCSVPGRIETNRPGIRLANGRLNRPTNGAEHSVSDGISPNSHDIVRD